MNKEMTTIWVKKKDRDFLAKLKKKLQKNGIAATLESIINAYKKHLSKEELE